MVQDSPDADAAEEKKKKITTQATDTDGRDADYINHNMQIDSETETAK